MVGSKNWDWETRKKSIAMGDWEDKFGWVEEPYASPDGEKIAAQNTFLFTFGAIGDCGFSFG